MQPITSPQKKKQTSYTNDSVLESLRDLGSGITKTVTKDVIARSASDALSSLFGHPTGGDLKPPSPIVEAFPERSPNRFSQIRQPEVYKPVVVDRREEPGMREKVAEVRAQLVGLAATIKKFNREIERAVEDIPTRPGVYHMNFLERLRGVIMILRQQIEDSSSWLALWSHRKQKKQYWGMYKKHGTSFGLSSERGVSTQAG